MQIVTIGGSTYLGTVERGEEQETVLVGSLCLGTVGGVTKENLKQYLVAEKTNNLEKPVSIEGLGGMISKRDLPDDLAMELKILRMRMDQAEALAVPELVAKKFEQLA